MNSSQHYDVIIIGAGAAGLMCAIESSKRGLKTLLIEHGGKIGGKILISGGGFCNFTNLDVQPEKYVSQNPHFSRSALKQYDQHQFIKWVEKHDIPYYEKKLGQLFCKNSSKDILNALLTESKSYETEFQLNTSVTNITRDEDKKTFHITSSDQKQFSCHSLVIATGGLSIPKMGATGFAYDIAKQFGHSIIPCEPALVGYIFNPSDADTFQDLPGVSKRSKVTCNKTSFEEGLLFIHDGLSGPSILQSSLYWESGDSVTINFLPETSRQKFEASLQVYRKEKPKLMFKRFLYPHLPKRLIDKLVQPEELLNKEINQLSNRDIQMVMDALYQTTISPKETVGYKKAEVTRGGISTKDVSSKTMESKRQEGLFFIGEAMDVTGWLGGYNFQWAWSSGWVAGQNV